MIFQIYRYKVSDLLPELGNTAEDVGLRLRTMGHDIYHHICESCLGKKQRAVDRWPVCLEQCFPQICKLLIFPEKKDQVVLPNLLVQTLLFFLIFVQAFLYTIITPYLLISVLNTCLFISVGRMIQLRTRKITTVIHVGENNMKKQQQQQKVRKIKNFRHHFTQYSDKIAEA